jgi:mRNA-degrading endonuclease RelE of RelBE toxin-antitoxin system
MKDRILKLYNEYKLAIMIALGIIIIGLTSILIIYSFSDKSEVKKYKASNYLITYDNSWKIKNKDDTKIVLNHKSNSTVTFEIINLEEQYKYYSTDDLLDELLYNLESQNSSYKLISKEKDYITKYEYEGYKVLYENDNNQAMITIAKKSDKMLLITYEAPSDYFDILLDSVHNMIYDFQIVDDNFSSTYKLNIETSNIEWSQNSEITSKLRDNSNYQIASNNYLISYSVPNNFEISGFDSTSSYFNYRGLKSGSITLTANIRNINIYEYIDKDGSYGTLYYSYNTMRDSEEGYSAFKENLERIENTKYVNYVYKNSYKFSKSYGKYDYEEVVVIYELDANHILLFEIKSTDSKIPRELINKIKLNSSKNYANYVERKVVDEKLIGELKEYTTYSRDKVRTVTLKIPINFNEIDKGSNIYTSRNYGMDYNSDTDLYKYNVAYDLSLSEESAIKNINSSYEIHDSIGSYQTLIYSNDIVLNGKTFKVYKGGYTDTGGALSSLDKYYVSSTVLVYNFDDGKCLIIEIQGNDVKISNDLLNDLTNFDINIK